VVAAIEHVLQKRLEEFRDGFAAQPPGGDRTEQAVNLMWSLTNGPTFNAWLELLVASRTDAELQSARALMAEKQAEMA